jgi:hypothetical protein
MTKNILYVSYAVGKVLIKFIRVGIYTYVYPP